jgi:hypothetical protein
MKKHEYEEVEIMKVDGAFHLATNHPDYEFHEKRKIPKWLWDAYNEIQPKAIDMRRRIERYFKAVKDKPMIVSKNHEDEHVANHINL